MARATVAGSGALAASSDRPVEELRQNVTSPGGTTQAALGVLMAEDGIQPLFDRAIAAGTRRSHELA
jgi:pyrroline-5-carboxylate reductase